MRHPNWTAVRRALAAALVAGSATAAGLEPPAFRLGDLAVPKAYEVQLAVDPLADTFESEIRIELVFNRASPVLWLNGTKLDVQSARFEQGGRAIAAKVVDGGEDFIGFEAQGEPFA